MNAASERIMFEIYRTTGPGRLYRVVYYTELDERNRETEIDRAMAGDHIYDGFISGPVAERAKEVIADVVARLNAGSPGSLIQAYRLERPVVPHSLTPRSVPPRGPAVSRVRWWSAKPG